MFSMASIAEQIRECTVAVTGAGGFIGRSVVGALVEHGANVRALISAPGQPVSVLHSERVRNLCADITDKAALRGLFEGADVAIHMAGPPSVSASFEDPVEYARVHVCGTAAVLDECRRTKMKRFVYLSSAEVYGQPQTNPITEQHPLAPRSPYAAAKCGAESFISTFTATCGMSSVILRPFSIYGADAPSGGVVSTILRMARFEDSIVLGDLSPIRDFCHVDDLTAAILGSCVVRLESSQVVNIGTGKGVSVGDFAKAALTLVGRSIPIREDASRRRCLQTEIQKLVADPMRARQVLGWKASLSLEEGIRRSI